MCVLYFVRAWPVYWIIWCLFLHNKYYKVWILSNFCRLSRVNIPDPYVLSFVNLFCRLVQGKGQVNAITTCQTPSTCFFTLRACGAYIFSSLTAPSVKRILWVKEGWREIQKMKAAKFHNTNFTMLYSS